MLKSITSKTNPLIKEAFAYKKEAGEHFLIEGFHSVEMALMANLVDELFLLKEYPNCPLPQYLVTPEIIDKLAFTRNPEGIVALCHKPLKRPFDGTRLLYLERVQDPGNLGTLLRTALAFGFHDVFISKDGCSPYNPKALLASQGALFSLNVQLSLTSSSEDIEALKAQGYFILGTALKEASAFESFHCPEGKLALLLGNEGQGLDEKVLALCDAKIKISMAGIDSLNVGVAGGILMYAFGNSGL